MNHIRADCEGDNIRRSGAILVNPHGDISLGISRSVRILRKLRNNKGLLGKGSGGEERPISCRDITEFQLNKRNIGTSSASSIQSISSYTDFLSEILSLSNWNVQLILRNK